MRNEFYVARPRLLNLITLLWLSMFDSTGRNTQGSMTSTGNASLQLRNYEGLILQIVTFFQLGMHVAEKDVAMEVVVGDGDAEWEEGEDGNAAEEEDEIAAMLMQPWISQLMISYMYCINTSLY
ncbi:hypothetical protein GYMLUDRAFT_1028687 [Collybiopsis luxurians FD-317 M1]|uniref:Uncharacterized protein n=1 Tax=Collybiopsis luxurians FD-317 M1 TaxID=944289 RepID=A0A0D0AQH5_9AGAR|nr:hypothetical protein GYMLUDRAFT_1028687 [Collybiopsis luxurians FD-317 M1]